MKPTADYIANKFQEFNGQMFGGKLTMPPIQLSRASTFVGQCAAKKRIDLFMSNDPYFNRFPNSSAFNVVMAKEGDFMPHIVQAEPLEL